MNHWISLVMILFSIDCQVGRIKNCLGDQHLGMSVRFIDCLEEGNHTLHVSNPISRTGSLAEYKGKGERSSIIIFLCFLTADVL